MRARHGKQVHDESGHKPTRWCIFLLGGMQRRNLGRLRRTAGLIAADRRSTRMEKNEMAVEGEGNGKLAAD